MITTYYSGDYFRLKAITSTSTLYFKSQSNHALDSLDTYICTGPVPVLVSPKYEISCGLNIMVFMLSVAQLTKLLDCIVSKAFYIFSNMIFYADCVKHVTPIISRVLSFAQLRSPLSI